MRVQLCDPEWCGSEGWQLEVREWLMWPDANEGPSPLEFHFQWRGPGIPWHMLFSEPGVMRVMGQGPSTNIEALVGSLKARHTDLHHPLHDIDGIHPHVQECHALNSGIIRQAIHDAQPRQIERNRKPRR